MTPDELDLRYRMDIIQSLEYMKYCRRVLLGTRVVVFGFLDTNSGHFFLDRDEFRTRQFTPSNPTPVIFNGYKGEVEVVTLEHPVSGKHFKMVHVEVEPKSCVHRSMISGKWMVNFNHNWYEAESWKEALELASALHQAHYCVKR
jgi:hypothetical protein